MLKFIYTFYAPDEGGGSSGGTGDGDDGNTKGGEGEGGSGSDKTGSNGDSDTDKGNGDPPKDAEGSKKKKVEFTPEQNEEINRIVQANAKKLKESIRVQNETEKLKAQNEFKTLYEKSEERIKSELEPKATLADELTALTNTNIDGEIASWPEELREQDPGKDNVRDRLKWVSNSRKLAARLKAAGTAPNLENGGGKPGGGGDGGGVLGIVNQRYHKPGGKK